MKKKRWQTLVSGVCASALVVGSVPAPYVNAADGVEAEKQTVTVDAVGTEQAAQENELMIKDNYKNFDKSLSEDLGDAASIKIATNISGVGQTVLPSQVTTVTGWKDGGIFWESEETERTLGNNINGETFTFESGSNTQIRSIYFKLTEKAFVIPEGATITFENCKFNSTIINNGTAVFNNCTFESGQIENNGTASYTGTTQEPENIAKPETPEEKELMITDNYADLDQILAESLGDANIVKIAFNLSSTGQTVLPAQVTTVTGWQKGSIFAEEGETERTLGNNIDGDTFTFAGGSNTTVKNIKFRMPEKSITIPEGVTVTFENCTFNSTIVNNGTAVFHNCTFENGQIENNGSAEYTGTTQEPENIAKPETPVGGELIIDSSAYQNLDVILAERLGTSDVVKLAWRMSSTGQTVLPAQVKLFTGWEKNFMYDQEKVQSVGNNIQGDTFRFENGSKTTVRSIDFNMTEKSIEIPKDAQITFENCSFSSTIINNGSAVFNNCTFENGIIENNGSAEYINGTKEPENIGTPAETYIPLGLIVKETMLNDAVKGTEYHREVAYELSGTNKKEAQVTASVEPSDSGIEAKVEDGTLILSGTPTKEGTITVTVSASAKDEKEAVQEIQITVNKKIGVTLEGELDCVTAGQTQYQNYLTVYVTDENGNKVNYYDYIQDAANADAKLDVSLSPEGSGMQAYWLYDSVVVAGDAANAGTYQVTVTLTDKGQSITSESKELRIYTGKETLKGQLETLDPKAETWDMEPYEIWNSDHAVIPVSLKTIYGSHESGLYGIIGNNEAVGSDTLVVPAGCDLTLENIKIYSSVKIIVEEGASLTLSDSVAYGAVEVNGGTFSMKNNAAVTDTVTLNDGSVMKDADLVSNGRYLSDGSQKPVVDTVVIVNGHVTVEGTNVITGEAGNGEEPGQNAIQVNGELEITKGSTLTAIGGGDYLPAFNGGTGVILNNGVISGEGTLIAHGGNGSGGYGGVGIDGTGIVSVAELESKGGDSNLSLGIQGKGGDAVSKDVIVKTTNPVIIGGKGNPDGSSEIVVGTVDKSALESAVNTFDTYSKDDYTAESFEVFAKALEVAKEVLANANVTQEEVDNALNDLNGAAEALEKKPVEQAIQVSYRTHVQNEGWQDFVSNGEMSGTKGKGLRLEGIEIRLDNNTIGGSVEYRTHVQNEGWQDYVADGAMSGTKGKSLRLEAIQVRLTGEMAEKYDIYYRTHIQDKGWLGWAVNDGESGSAGLSKRLEGIEIRLVEKGGAAPGSTDNAYLTNKKEANPTISYRTHVQNEGWQDYVTGGELSGTKGKSLRLEAIQIKVNGDGLSGGVEYSTHVQNEGWQDYVADDAISGTKGKSLRLEAIKIRLTGELAQKYSVEYRTHVQNEGWQNWVKDDAMSGTKGKSLRLEGIEIRLVKK